MLLKTTNALTNLPDLLIAEFILIDLTFKKVVSEAFGALVISSFLYSQFTANKHCISERILKIGQY